MCVRGQGGAAEEKGKEMLVTTSKNLKEKQVRLLHFGVSDTFQ